MEDIYEQKQRFTAASGRSDAGALFVRVQLAEGLHGPLAARYGLDGLLFMPGAVMRNYGIRSCYVPPAYKLKWWESVLLWAGIALGVLLLAGIIMGGMALAALLGEVLR